MEVVAAVVVRGDLVLCAQRGPGHLAGLWEFPGGKVEPGEEHRSALVREIAEELGCVVSVEGMVSRTRHDAEHGSLMLTTYRCTLVSGEPNPLEHAALRWLPPEELAGLDWAPADLPTVALLRGGCLGAVSEVGSFACHAGRRTYST